MIREKILVFVSGGVVTDVQTSSDAEIIIIDHDNLRAGDGFNIWEKEGMSIEYLNQELESVKNQYNFNEEGLSQQEIDAKNAYEMGF